ncbi:MAG: YcxB family protein [Huintestinicola sp.]
MNNILDDDFYDDGRGQTEELLAAGQYESSTESIMKGFKIFQKYYVYKNVAFQMLLVVLGLASQVMAIISAGENSDVSTSYFLCAVCVVLGIYILMRPRSTRKRLEKGITELKGTVYNAEIFTDKIKITTVYDPYIENQSEEEEKPETSGTEEISDETGSENDEEENVIPATIVHLDNSAVELVDTEELYVLYVKKVNFFVIPKSAFKPYEVIEIKNRLSNIMGVRYRQQ